MSLISRRGLLKGLVAGAIVAGFDPASRSWVTEARAAGSPDFSTLPPLDGRITTDPAELAAHADDFGHIVHRTPYAVLYPGSVEDVVKVVRFARAHGIRIASRGKGHTAFGQSQVAAGVSIDMTTLDEIHSISSDSALVDAGVVWRDLLLATIDAGLTPPVLTDYIGLTVGGTLSVGGVSGASYIQGAQVDNVLELQVVTGEGEIVTCSASHQAGLFDAALAGLGLCAIIVRAKIRLIEAEAMARTHRAFYADVASMVADMTYLIHQERFDHLRGNAVPSPDGWAYYIEGTSFHTPDGDGVPADPFAGLNFLPGSQMVEDVPYFDFCDAVYQLIEFLKLVGLYALPHPWVDLFVPGSRTAAFASNAVANLDPSTMLPGSLVLLYPFRGSRLSRPLLRVPEEEVFFLFDILHTAPPVPEIVAGALHRNRVLYDQNVALGGTEYTISAVELSAREWKSHFQPAWGTLDSAKKRFDPDNVLGAGLPVFD